jgi:hypothetical protein
MENSQQDDRLTINYDKLNIENPIFQYIYFIYISYILRHTSPLSQNYSEILQPICFAYFINNFIRY